MQYCESKSNLDLGESLHAYLSPFPLPVEPCHTYAPMLNSVTRLACPDSMRVEPGHTDGPKINAHHGTFKHNHHRIASLLIQKVIAIHISCGFKRRAINLCFKKNYLMFHFNVISLYLLTVISLFNSP